MEQQTNAALTDDVKQAANRLYYSGCAVLDPDRHAKYLLQDARADAEHRAEQAEETVDELRVELGQQINARELLDRELKELEVRHQQQSAEKQAELRLARSERDSLSKNISMLSEQLKVALHELQNARVEVDRLEVLLRRSEAKLEAEIERRWALEERSPATARPARRLTQRHRIEQMRIEALSIATSQLPEIVKRLQRAETVDKGNGFALSPLTDASDDALGQLAKAFNEVFQQAVLLASEQAMLRSNVNSMFVNLSRRSQSLVQRQLRLIDELENSEQDPDQLANLFKLDHLATRMRRNGENLLVLAGEEPGRKWSQAVRLLDVTRAGASEVEQYERVALRDLPDVNVLGRVVNDLVHLVAELLENATSFSAPETRVTVTANMLNTGGVMLEVEDAGIGMTPEELDDANERLANPPVIDVAISRRMGLYVVGRLATRHGVQVRLRRSAGGGITALVLIPSALLTVDQPTNRPSTNHPDPARPAARHGRNSPW